MAEYLEAAATLTRNNTMLFSSRSIFLSTDDPDIIDGISRGDYDHTNFTFYYTRYGYSVMGDKGSGINYPFYALYLFV